MKKAQFSITCGEISGGGKKIIIGDTHPDLVRKLLTAKKTSRRTPDLSQTALVFPD
jgi:hypothetical protein